MLNTMNGLGWTNERMDQLAEQWAQPAGQPTGQPTGQPDREAMSDAHARMWARLQAYSFDDWRPARGSGGGSGAGEPSLTFAARLARENGWSSAFSERVLEEYKRFVFLAMTAGHPVTPSDQVDQAWHLHLTYTRAYWDRLCGQVLGRPLHHNPTVGGAAEDAKFEDWYERTKSAYRAAFAQEPPADIWPDNDARFDHDAFCRRVNTLDNLVVPKDRVRSVAGAAGMLAAASLAMAGCGTVMAATGGGTAGLVALFVVIGAIALYVVIKALRAISRSASSGGSSDSGCSSWWMASGGAGSGGGAGWGSSSGGHGQASHGDGASASTSGGTDTSSSSDSSSSDSSSSSSSDSSGCSSSGCSSGCSGGGGD